MTPAFERNWAETYRYAAERSPYYRELFRQAAGVPPLQSIATVDKQIVSERNLDFLCVPRERVIEIVTTSGTTGEALLWMLTESDLQRLAVNERISFECAGLTEHDTVLVAVAMDRAFVAGLAYWLGLREIGCSMVRVGASTPLLVLEMMTRVRPTAIVGVPSFLRLIADKAREAGVDLSACSVRKVICIGEPVRNRDWTLNASGQAIAQAWRAQLFSTYGVTELANSVCECVAGMGGHVHTEQLYLEILDDAGNQVPDGEIGEVVASTFGVEAMPLIRYRTGDCAAIFRGPCPCGRSTPRLGPIVGRRHQKLKVRGASLFPSTLAGVLEQTAGVERFVILARKESDLSDSIEVLVDGAAPLDAVREALQARAKTAPIIRHASREEIETLQAPPEARKRRTFVDLR